MKLTDLEAGLLTGLILLLSSGVTGVLVRMVMGRKYVTQSACQQHHKAEEEQRQAVETRQSQDMEELKRSIDTLFQMNRALVTYSDIPVNEKTKILNSHGKSDKG